MSMGLGFQGDIWFAPLMTYDSSTPSDQYRLVSDSVIDVRIDTGDMYATLGDISSPSIVAWLSQPSDPALHVEWVLQPNATSSLATFCVMSTPSSDLHSLRFVIGSNTDGATQSWWVLDGCKAKNFHLSATRGKEFICSADFSVKSATTSTTATGTKPSAIGTEFARFNQASVGITVKEGSTSAGNTKTIYITDSVDLTVENNLVDYWDCDSATKQACLRGRRNITGSSDVSLENGGAAHWGDVFKGQAYWSINIVTGCTGKDDTFYLNEVRYTNASVDINQNDSGMMNSQPFTARHIEIS